MRQRGSLFSDDMVVGLFPMTIFGYAVGLTLANIAANFFEAGQPALLYIVPLTLWPVLYRTKMDGSLDVLWEKLPIPRTIAMPLGSEEQRALLNDRDVIAASATWGESHGEMV